MFCATTDKIQNLTEKTKLLAQKCSQQLILTPCVPSGPVNDTTTVDTKDAGNATIKDDFRQKCLCAYQGTIGRLMAKKLAREKERSTKWYIKVKHNLQNIVRENDFVVVKFVNELNRVLSKENLLKN